MVLLIQKINDTSFADEMLKSLYNEFKKSTYFINSLVGLSFEKSMKAFLFVVCGIHDNVEFIIESLKPIYSADILKMNTICCCEEKKMTCQHCKDDCNWDNCTYAMKDLVFCPVKKS